MFTTIRQLNCCVWRLIEVVCVTVKEKTGSSKGAAILKEWDKYLPLFWQMVPPSEEDTPEANAKYDTSAAEQVTLQSA